MPCEEYTLQDEYDYFFNSLAGDFAAGEWKNQDAEEWKNGCVADLRRRPPQVTRAHSGKTAVWPTCAAVRPK